MDSPFQPDVILVGAGIMSATVGVLLKELNPALTIEMFESLEGAGLESSSAWNNAGTGHAANCELNYTPEEKEGGIDISKALKVNEAFDLSLQFWSYLVKKRALPHPETFIHSVPHISFVTGSENVAFLKKRYEVMAKHHCYSSMEYTEDKAKLKEWIPLVMEGRDAEERGAATRVLGGTDIDFGALTRSLFEHLERIGGFKVHYAHRVVDICRKGSWHLKIKEIKTGQIKFSSSQFVFLGAGGGVLSLLQKSDIPEIKGYAGFPVSGLWLRCDDLKVAQRHQAKVYGKASIGSPPMSVPHLDTRIVNGKRSLLFGPYAGFSSKFLKEGSFLDLFCSIRPGNIGSLLAVARDNVALTKYLITQVFQSPRHRFASLQEYYPNAKLEEWRLETAGQRVQIIKPDPKRGAILQFGTELISASDHSLVGLLGASPGASIAVSIALELVERCFPSKLTEWLPRLREIIPSYGKSLIDNAELCKQIRSEIAETLKTAIDK